MTPKLNLQSLLKNTAVLGSSSIISIFVGLFATKFWAILLGPGGLGFMGLLQNLVSLVGLIVGLGIGSGIVRYGSAEIARENYGEVAVLRRAAWLLFGMSTALSIIILVVFQTPLSVAMLGSAEYSGYVALMALPLALSLASGVQTSLLNAHHRISALAKIGVFNSVCGTATGLGCVWVWGQNGIVPAVIANAAVAWGLSAYWLRREVHPIDRHVSWPEVVGTAKSLARFGIPYTASMLVGTGVQLALPALALHLLGIESVGFYRAALAISVSYLGFLLAAMGQDYYPRISAASDRPDELVHLVNQQHRLVMLLAVPMIMGVLALTPYIVPLLYTQRFAPAADLLEWQLIGDLFKFSSWTMGFVILARSGSKIYFVTEFIAGITTLLSSWLFMQSFGLVGLGISFVLTYIVYYLITFFIVRREIGLIWTSTNKRMMIAAVTAAAIIRLTPFIGLEYLRTPIALLFAAISGLVSLAIIGQEMGGWRNVPTLLRGISK